MSFLKTFGLNLLRSKSPGLLVFFVTDRCNCCCPMCFNAANVFSEDRAQDMPLDKIQKIAASLRPLPQLLLSGGEPFMRNDIARILQLFYDEADTRQFSIPTNGTFPKRIVSTCTEVLDKNPDIALNINLSLDNIGMAHDGQRGLDGCYERVCESYDKLIPLRTKYKGLSVNISTIITEDTATNADEIIGAIRSRFSPNYHGIGILRSSYESAVPEALLRVLVEKLSFEVREKKSFNALPFLSEIAAAVGKLIRKKYIKSLSEQKRCFKCLAGEKIIVITADGRLMPCEPLWLEKEIRNSEDDNHYMIARLEEFDYNVAAALATPRAQEIISFVAEEKCWCSYMCAIQNGILYNPRRYPEVLLEILKG